MGLHVKKIEIGASWECASGDPRDFGSSGFGEFGISGVGEFGISEVGDFGSSGFLWCL